MLSQAERSSLREHAAAELRDADMVIDSIAESAAGRGDDRCATCRRRAAYCGLSLPLRPRMQTARCDIRGRLASFQTATAPDCPKNRVVGRPNHKTVDWRLITG